MKSIPLPRTRVSKLLIALMMLMDMLQERNDVDSTDERYKYAFNAMIDVQDRIVLEAREEGLVQDTPSEDRFNLPDITRAELEIEAAKQYIEGTMSK
jgi:hypothetical protein